MNRELTLATLTLALTLLALPSAWAISLNILEPTQNEYSFGTIPVEVQLLNDSGASIQANVLASVLGPANTWSINLTYQDGKYTGSFKALERGYYTVTAWSVIDGQNYTSQKTIYVNSSQLQIQVLAPTGNYGPGQIPIKLNVILAGKQADDVKVNSSIYNGASIVWNKELSYPYTDLVSLGPGEYSFTAKAYAQGTSVDVKTNFTVSKDAFYLDIVNPKNSTYTGEIPIDIDVWSNGEFVHHVPVKVCAYYEGNLTECVNVPEAQYHYSTKMKLEPGEYKLVANAKLNGNQVTSSVWITIPGVRNENGTSVAIPGNKPMEVDEIWTNLERRYYSTGVTGTIAVDLKDPVTGSYITNANVSACVHWKNETKCMRMNFSKTPIPSYYTMFTFPDESWYEIVVNATAPGYKRILHRFPPIKVGRPPIQIPAGSEKINQYIFSITSPSQSQTYPSNKGVEILVQLLDNQGMPITNANITAEITNQSIPLTYKINGGYYATTGPLRPGRYTVNITVITNSTKFSRERNFTVSNDTLFVKIVNPTNSENVTNRTVLVQAEVTDQSGDIVPNADVELVARSPKTGSHRVDMTRDLSTGYYQTLYTLDSPGIWRINVTAKKTGMLPSSAAVEFNASFPVKQTFTPREVVAALVLIVALIIIGLIVRAIV